MYPTCLLKREVRSVFREFGVFDGLKPTTTTVKLISNSLNCAVIHFSRCSGDLSPQFHYSTLGLFCQVRET